MTTTNDTNMAQRVREFDWGQTPLGPQALWRTELKTAVGILLESRFPQALVWGPELITIYNDAFRPILGDKPEALGRSFADIWAEAWDQIGPIAAKAYAGEATFIQDFPLVVERRGSPEQAWFTFCYSPVRLEDGSVAGMMDTVVETTATVRTHADLHVLNQELRHRLKNTLATVQALARGTLRGVVERPAFEALIDRIIAMGAAHDVLFEKGWTSASAMEVARATLAAMSGRIDLQGEDVPIGARTAVSLSLVLHELATNAAKYGALSVPNGRVSLQWSLDHDTERLKITWREMGGPEALPPEHLGFGTRLIDMGLSRGGTVKRSYLPSGFQAEIDTPLTELAGGG